MKVTSEFSENCPVRYTIKGTPLSTTDKWRISNVESSLDEEDMILNVVGDKTIEIIPTKETSNSCTVNTSIEFYDMPLPKDPITLSFDWEGTYVAPTLPIIAVKNISSVDNGQYVYRAEITNASTYPVSYEWSIDKTFGFETGSQVSAENIDDDFRVTYSDISDADGEAGTTFTITLKIRAKYNPTKILETKTFKVHTTYETPVITADSNPIIMNYCYEAGWCSDSTKMYKDECAAVTSFSSDTFKRGTGTSNEEYVPESFDEFQYFVNVTSIPTSAFHYDSSKFKSIILPPNITKIGSSAFQGCFGLTEITIPKNVTSIGTNAFYLNHQLKTVNILGNLTEIGSEAFYNCGALTKLDLSKTSLKTLSDRCFYNTHHVGTYKTMVLLPESLTYIGKNALVNPNIIDMRVFASTAPDTDPNAFTDDQYTIGAAYSSEHKLYIPSTATGYDDGAWSYISNNWQINSTL